MLADMEPRKDWMDEVTELRRRIDPAIAIARTLIHDSRFEIVHMPKVPI